MPQDPRTYSAHQWLTLLTLVLHKHGLHHVVLTEADAIAFTADGQENGGLAVLVNETREGHTDLRLTTMAGAQALMARQRRDGHL